MDIYAKLRELRQLLGRLEEERPVSWPTIQEREKAVGIYHAQLANLVKAIEEEKITLELMLNQKKEAA